MALQIKSIQKLPKHQFKVVFRSRGTEFQTLATVHPKWGHAMTFHNADARAALIDSGRDARLLCDLILKVQRGVRPKFPCTLADKTRPPRRKAILTTPSETLLKIG